MEQEKNKKKNIKVLNLKDEVASYYQHLLTLIPKAQHIILHSGRGTTKSTFFSMYDLIRLMYYPKADILVVGYEYDKMIQTVYQDYKFAAEVLQIPKQHIEFYSTKNGETWIKVKNKWGGTNKIWFEHGKRSSEGFKGIRPTIGNKWLTVRFYELTNFINWNAQELENICATFTRNSYKTILWDKVEEYCKKNNVQYNKSLPLKEKTNWLYKQSWFQKDAMNNRNFETHEFCFTYEFNTPASTEQGGGWVIDWLETAKQKNNVYYQFNNYLDMSEYEKFKFLGSDTLQEAENLKNTRPAEYNWIWLGKRPYEGDITFPMLNKNIHFGKFEDFHPDILVIGVDVGRSDATVCTLNGFEYKYKDLRIAIGMHRWSHCNRKCQYIKDGRMLPYKSWSISEYANMILEFCDMCHEEFPWARIYFQMDREGAGQDFYDACFRFKSPLYLNVDRLWTKKNPSERIDAMQTALSIPGVVKIYDPVTYTAYQNQVWDKKREKDGERKRLDDPSKPSLDMDSQDSAEYAWLPWFFQIVKERIIKNKGKFKPENKIF